MPRVFILVFVLVHLVLFLFLQGHLSGNQLFCFFGVFVFGDSANCTNTICQVKFERLMCEVEFWEVFWRMCEIF